jgi:hypothetical protein
VSQAGEHLPGSFLLFRIGICALFHQVVFDKERVAWDLCAPYFDDDITVTDLACHNLHGADFYADALTLLNIDAAMAVSFPASSFPMVDVNFHGC